MWFKNTPTKIEKYVLENEIGYFLRYFFKKFPLFSKNIAQNKTKALKKAPFGQTFWKIEKSWGLLTFAHSLAKGEN
ncbi:hypothetical protein [Algoriphagus confluentis]|uniref:hypothetical protein n=1 Tax=Algoriphagus confluentis TaxID=1697556 RepID=UPI0030C6B9C1